MPSCYEFVKDFPEFFENGDDTLVIECNGIVFMYDLRNDDGTAYNKLLHMKLLKDEREKKERKQKEKEAEMSRLEAESNRIKKMLASNDEFPPLGFEIKKNVKTLN